MSDATLLEEIDIHRPKDASLMEISRDALWGVKGRLGQDEGRLAMLLDYSDGNAGIPDVDDGAGHEIRELAKQSVRNVCGVVVDTFVRGLAVVGFRSPTDDDNDPAWAWWQKFRLDARQEEVHRAALTYGVSYVSVLPNDDDDPEPVMWSPRNVTADYDDPRRDLFPRSAVLSRKVHDPMLGRGTSVLMVDDVYVQAGFIPEKARARSQMVPIGDPVAHGATYDGKPVCPVVRFVNERSAEDRPPRGEVEPLIEQQRAINSVNFDRLVISRYSAFKQKVIVGWSGSRDDVKKAGANRIWTFEDAPADVNVTQLDESPLAAHDGLIREMTESVALAAGIPLHQLTGSLQNISTDTAALAEAAHQRKLGLKRLSFGESWEQVIRLAVEMAGGQTPDDAAEVVWLETEARAFGAVVDGITKLASMPTDPVPIEELLDYIPGMNQQREIAIRDAIRARRNSAVLASLSALGAGAE